MKKAFVFFSSFCWFSIAVAQSEAKTKPLFQPQVSIGFVTGQAGPAYQAQLVNTLQWKRFGLGLGFGVDDYTVRTLPLFMQVSQQLTGNKNAPFVYASGGLHFPAASGRSDVIVRTKKGLNYEGGIGFRLQQTKRTAVFFQLGYAFKQVEQTWETDGFCVGFNCPNNVQRYDYRLRRISFRMGVAL